MHLPTWSPHPKHAAEMTRGTTSRVQRVDAASVKAPENNQISDVNYGLLSHGRQCGWATYLSSGQSEMSAHFPSPELITIINHQLQLTGEH